MKVGWEEKSTGVTLISLDTKEARYVHLFHTFVLLIFCDNYLFRCCGLNFKNTFFLAKLFQAIYFLNPAMLLLISLSALLSGVILKVRM